MKPITKEITYQTENGRVTFITYPLGDSEIFVKLSESACIYSLSEAYRTIKVLQDVLRANDPDYEEKMLALMGEKGEEIK